MLLYFPDDTRLARRLVTAAAIDGAVVRRHRFPDGELKLTLPSRLPRRVVVLRSLRDPNEKLVELLLAAQAARSLGARHVTLVAPYLPYMRQDRAFAPGEAVSQRHVGALLGALFDRVVTIDPHLHRVHSLAEVIPETDAVAVSAAPLIGAFLRRRAPGALLVGPDAESSQWVEAIAAAAGAEWTVARKARRGDRRVRVELPSGPFRGRRVVLIDDVISTGRTLAQAARALLRAGASQVDVVATHAIFAGDAADALRAAGIATVWSTDAIPHETNAMRVAALLAAVLR
jgi:ribose-phosphate pyrophosphokinase